MNGTISSTTQTSSGTTTCNEVGYHNLWSEEFEKFESLEEEIHSMYGKPTTDFALMSSLWQEAQEIYVNTLAMQGFAGLEYGSMTDKALGSSCAAQYNSYIDSFICASNTGNFAFSATSPCCGRCTIVGGPVQLFYWPTPAPDPPVSTLISSGFTL
jgi:hypothetical protein